MTASHSQGCRPAGTLGGDGAGFILPSGALYFGPEMQASTHVIHNYLVYIATQGSFDLILPGGKVSSSCEAAVIAPDWPHRIVSRGARLSIFYLVPETDAGRRAAAFSQGRKVFAPPARVVSAALPRLRAYAEHGCDTDEADDVSTYLFDNLAPPLGPAAVFDERVVHTINYLNSAAGRRVTIGEAAAEVALSSSRLEHLFTEQVGIPIRSYLLWGRVRYALQLMVGGDSLTEVALEAGFFDSSHLSRTFRRMVGIAPSTLLRKTSLYRVRRE